MKWQKSPDKLIELFASILPGPPAITRKMFGYPAGFVNGNMFLGLFQDAIILRLSETDREVFMKNYSAHLFEPMPGRPLKEYVEVPKSITSDPKELSRWVARAFAYGTSLKPKLPGKKAANVSSKTKSAPAPKRKK